MWSGKVPRLDRVRSSERVGGINRELEGSAAFRMMGEMGRGEYLQSLPLWAVEDILAEKLSGLVLVYGDGPRASRSGAQIAHTPKWANGVFLTQAGQGGGAGQAPPLTRAESAGLADMHPTVQALAVQHRNAARSAGINAHLRPGFRTYAEQRILRDGPNQAAAAGRSLHNFGLAYHIIVIDRNGRYANADHPGWAAVANLAPQGVTAGAGWTDPDLPHYEYSGGNGITTLRERWEANQDPLTGLPRTNHLCSRGACP